MNKLRIIILLFSDLSLLFLSCEKPEVKPAEVEKTLSIQFNEKSVTSTINYFDLTVLSNCDWKISKDADWITISPDDTLYTTSTTLSLKVDENTKTISRTAVLKFLYCNKSEILTITQDAFDAYLNVSVEEISFGYRTAEKDILVTSNCGWFAQASEYWAAIKPSTGLIGNFDMNINVETNNTSSARSAQIHIWNEDYQLDKYVTITQDAQPDIEAKDYIDEYGINWGKGEMIRGLTWAPVNCGYKADEYPLGKIFQWGRKFGLGYQDETYKDASAPIIADTWSGLNGAEDKNTYYRYSDNSKFNYDWIKEGDDTYWNLGTEENPQKNAEFDPCPDGWRTPTAFEFKSLIGYANRQWTQKEGWNGYLFSENIDEDNPEAPGATFFLPAGGRLNVVDGKAYDRNIEAYYWTISINAGSSAYLYFYNEDCSVNAQGSRAGGCLIRCIKE